MATDLHLLPELSLPVSALVTVTSEVSIRNPYIGTPQRIRMQSLGDYTRRRLEEKPLGDCAQKGGRSLVYKFKGGKDRKGVGEKSPKP